MRLRRLIHSLESIVLAANLPHVGEPEMIERYQEMLKLEASSFQLSVPAPCERVPLQIDS